MGPLFTVVRYNGDTQSGCPLFPTERCSAAQFVDCRENLKQIVGIQRIHQDSLQNGRRENWATDLSTADIQSLVVLTTLELERTQLYRAGYKVVHRHLAKNTFLHHAASLCAAFGHEMSATEPYQAADINICTMDMTKCLQQHIC